MAFLAHISMKAEKMPLKLPIHRCFELGESIKSVSEEIGYTRASIYSWRKKYLRGGITALMNDKNITPNTLTEGSLSTASAPDLAQLQTQIRDMQMEIDILKETINVLKKAPASIRQLSKTGRRQ